MVSVKFGGGGGGNSKLCTFLERGRNLSYLRLVRKTLTLRIQT